MFQKNAKVALITGASKGIGFELGRQLAQIGLRVILTARDLKQGEAAVEILRKEGCNVSFFQVDVTDQDTIDRVYDWVFKEFGRLDYLVNNAGMRADSVRNNLGKKSSILNLKIEILRASMEVNSYGALRMIQKFVPLMLKNGFGRIVNVASGSGQLSEMGVGMPGYRISKTGLNAITRIVANELSGSSVTVVSLCPGWVKTDMGGMNAKLEVSEAVKYMVRTLLDDRQNGVFLRFGERIEW